MGFGQIVCASLDPVLTPAGFAPGQYGDYQVIYCAAYDDFSDDFPHLPQSNDQERGIGCCVDFDLTLDADGLAVTIEGVPLAKTLRTLGLTDDAAMVQGLAAIPLKAALLLLEDVLPRLLAQSVGPPSNSM